MSGSPPPRLLADTMLGRLARWLRALGFDVAYDSRLDDAALVEKAVAEGRVLLTRDRRLVLRRRRTGDFLLIASESLEEQVRQVICELDLSVEPERLFGRCLRCNAPLQAASGDAVRGAVPEFVARTQRRFRRCPDCGRIFWAASHVARMRRRLEAMGLLG